MKPDLDPALHAFAKQLRQRLGHHVRHIMLFGSRARGDDRVDSDDDMLAVVESRVPGVRSTILEIERGLMDRHGVLVATVLRNEDEWRRSQEFPLALNVARESVTL